MENRETLDENTFSELTFSSEIKDYLGETSKWAKLISIVGFVYIGFIVIGAIMMGFFMGSMGAASGLPFSPIIFSLIYLLVALIMFFPILYLFRFASGMGDALKRNDTTALTDSFKNLKSHYKFYGITILVVLGLYALIFVVALIGGAGMFM